MSRDVSGGFYGAERPDEIAFRQQSFGPRRYAGQATLDFGLGFTREKRGVRRLLQEGQAAGIGDQLDVGRAELGDQGIDGAHVVHMGMGENDAPKGGAEAGRGGEEVALRPGQTRVHQGQPVGLTDLNSS